MFERRNQSSIGLIKSADFSVCKIEYRKAWELDLNKLNLFISNRFIHSVFLTKNRKCSKIQTNEMTIVTGVKYIVRTQTNTFRY